MEFHPQKCNVIACSRSTRPVHHDYHLKGTVLAHCTSSKYLGVDMSSDLSWNTHIDRITKKAYSMIGFLRRNLKVANEKTKSDAYRTLVRPHMEYCCAVWSPFTASNIKKLQSVQRRAARYATNRYHNTSSVTNMLHHLQWESLESRRWKCQLTMFYKIVNDIVNISPEPYLQKTASRTRSRHSHTYRHISTKTDYYKNSFSPPEDYPCMELPPSRCG